MKIATIKKLAKAQENEAFRTWFYAALEEVMAASELMARTVDLPLEEREKLPVWWLYCHAAEVGIVDGQSKDDFMEIMSNAYDAAHADAGGDDDDGDDEG